MWLDLGTSTVVQRHWSVWQAQGGPQGQLSSVQHTLLLPRKNTKKNLAVYAHVRNIQQVSATLTRVPTPIWTFIVTCMSKIEPITITAILLT